VTTEKTAVAIRVLTAINNRQTPTDGDVLLLRAYCPDHRDLDPDELACLVIQEAMERRKKTRTATGNGRPVVRETE
jgi:hypothetical protein